MVVDGAELDAQATNVVAHPPKHVSLKGCQEGDLVHLMGVYKLAPGQLHGARYYVMGMTGTDDAGRAFLYQGGWKFSPAYPTTNLVSIEK